MTALITDDNTMASALISRLTTEIEELQIICKYCSPSEAYNHIDENIGASLTQNSSVFTRVESGKDLQQINKIFIFITSQRIWTSTGHCQNHRDIPSSTYYNFPTIAKNLEGTFSHKAGSPTISNDDCIFVRDNSVIRRINTSDILYVEAMGDYVKFHTIQKTFTIHCTLKSVEQRLASVNFLRIHRSFIVALNKLDSVQDGGLIIGERFIPVADTYRKILHQKMNIL